MDTPVWKHALIDEDRSIGTTWSLPTLQMGDGSLVSPLTVDNAFSKFLQASPTAEVAEGSELFNGGLDRLKKFEATLSRDVSSPPPAPSKDSSSHSAEQGQVPVSAHASNAVDNDFPIFDTSEVPAPQIGSEPPMPSPDAIARSYNPPFSCDAPVARVLPRRTVSISAARIRLKLDTLPPVPTLKRASTLHAPASPLLVTPESRPLSAHSPINDVPPHGNLEDIRFGPERGRTGISPRNTSPARDERTKAPMPVTSSLSRKPNVSRSRSRSKKRPSMKSRPTTPSSNEAAKSSAARPMNGSKLYEFSTNNNNGESRLGVQTWVHVDTFVPLFFSFLSNSAPR